MLFTKGTFNDVEKVSVEKQKRRGKIPRLIYDPRRRRRQQKKNEDEKTVKNKMKDACSHGVQATLCETTTQINKKIYYDVLAFGNASLNRIFTRTTFTHTHTSISHATATKATATNKLSNGHENTGLIIHNKVEIL